MNELDCLLPVAQDHQFAINVVLFERSTYQTRIPRIVFYEQDKSGPGTHAETAQFLHTGL